MHGVCCYRRSAIRLKICLYVKSHVETPTDEPKDEWADHMRICITLDAAAVSQTANAARQVRELPPDFSGDRPIDAMYRATMDAGEAPDEALSSLLGSCAHFLCSSKYIR